MFTCVKVHLDLLPPRVLGQRPHLEMAAASRWNVNVQKIQCTYIPRVPRRACRSCNNKKAQSCNCEDK